MAAANKPPFLPPKTPGGRPPARLCDTPWALVVVCSALAGLASTVPQITVKSYILHHYGRNNAFAVNGTLESIRALVAFAMQPLLGNVSDTFGRRVPLAVCALGVVLPHFVLLLGELGWLETNVFTVWAFFYVGCGCFKGQDALATAYIVDVAPETLRAAAVGVNLAASYGLSSAVGNVGGTWITNHLGAATTYATACCLAVVNVLYIVLFLPESLARSKRRPCDCVSALPLASLRLLFRDSSGCLGRLCAAQFCAYALFFGFICNYQIFLQTALSFDGSHSAIYIASFGVMSFATKSSIFPLRKCLAEVTLIRIGFVGARARPARPPAPPPPPACCASGSACPLLRRETLPRQHTPSTATHPAPDTPRPCGPTRTPSHFPPRSSLPPAATAFAIGCALVALPPVEPVVLVASFLMAVGLVVSPCLASIASSLTPASQHGAVQVRRPMPCARS